MAPGKNTYRAVAFALALAAQAPAEPRPYGEFLDLGGHRVHYFCQGKGSRGAPIVVLLHGTPRFSFHFALVQPRIAEFARVCVYDRAGDAWSEKIPNQPQAQMFVDELDAFLQQISPRAPVVLVGHSVGGVLARAYLSQNPARVVAMVMIDTVEVPPERPSDDELRARLREQKRTVRPASTRKELAGTKPKAASAVPKPAAPFDQLPVQFYEAHAWATAKWNAYAAGVDPLVGLQYQADLYHLAALARPTTMPVWFIGRAEPASWADTQRRLAAFWPKSKLILVPKASHDIQLDRPDIVASTVREAVMAASDRR